MGITSIPPSSRGGFGGAVIDNGTIPHTENDSVCQILDRLSRRFHVEDSVCSHVGSRPYGLNMRSFEIGVCSRFYTLSACE